MPGRPVARVFELRDGKALNTGVPGIFTWDGYHTVFLPLLPQVTKDASEDGWVLGRQTSGKLWRTISQLNASCAATCWGSISTTMRAGGTRCWPTSRSSRSTACTGAGRAVPAVRAGHRRCATCCTAIDGQTQLSRPAAPQQGARRAGAKAAKVGQKLGGFAAF